MMVEDPESENSLFSEPMKIRMPSACSALPSRSMTSRLVSRSSNSSRTRSRSANALRSSSKLAWPRTISLRSSLSPPDQLARPAATIFCVSWSSSALPASSPRSSSALASARVRLRMRALRKLVASVRAELERGLEAGKAELDQLTQKIVAAGLASWSGGESEERKLIVRGHANLLEDLKALADLERVRLLFDDLETKRDVIDLLGRAEQADGVRLFIGSENKLFSLSGSSTIIAPYRDGAGRIVGVIGVIGPTRLNYARIIPMVDYTTKVVSKVLSG